MTFLFPRVLCVTFPGEKPSYRVRGAALPLPPGKNRAIVQIRAYRKRRKCDEKRKNLPAAKRWFADFDLFLLTDILTESSDLVFAGEGAKELAEAAFGATEENWVHVPGMVSRKKQFVPSVLSALQQ